MQEIETVIERIKGDIQHEKSEEEIVQSLLPLLGKDPEFDGQLAEYLAKIPHVKVAKILQRMLQVSNEKKVQKIVRRSLYRLKGKGIIFEDLHPEKEEPILRPLQKEPPKGFVNGYDFSWNRFLLLFVPQATRGLMVLHGVVNDEKGLLEFSGGEINRREFKDFFDGVQKASPTPVIEIDAAYVGFLFAQAHQITLNQRGTLPQGYLHWKSEVEKVKKHYEQPLIYFYSDAGQISGDDRMLSRGGDLLKADLFLSWRIEEDRIRTYADEVWEAQESKIVLNQAQREARVQGIYQKALSELFSGERRLLYKRRLEEMACLLLKLGREEEAKISLAVAIDLEKPLNLIQPNPFLLLLTVKSIMTLLAEANEKRATEPSLIVKP